MTNINVIIIVPEDKSCLAAGDQIYTHEENHLKLGPENETNCYQLFC